MRSVCLGALLVACTSTTPQRVTVTEHDPGRGGPQPLSMRQFVHIADDGDLLVVGGPLGASRSLTSRALFAELERLGPRGLTLLYSVDTNPSSPSAAARHTLKRIEGLNLPKKQVEPPPGASSPYGGGATLLMAKAQSGDVEWIDDLLSRGVGADAVDNDGKTALVYAAGAGRLQAVARLLRARASVDRPDNDGSTALMFAAQAGHLQIANALIAAGAHASYRGSHGLTALDLAQRGGHSAVVAMLRAAP